MAGSTSRIQLNERRKQLITKENGSIATRAIQIQSLPSDAICYHLAAPRPLRRDASNWPHLRSQTSPFELSVLVG